MTYEHQEGTDYVVKHIFDVSDHIVPKQSVLDGNNTGPLVASLHNFAVQEVKSNEQLVLDFQSITVIGAESAQEIAQFLFRFHTGALGEGQEVGAIYHLSLSSLIAGDTRLSLDRALRDLNLKVNPKLIFSAPMSEDPVPVTYRLRHHCIGRWNSVKRAQHTFAALWDCDTPISPQDLISRVESLAPGEGKQIHSDLGLLFKSRLVARVAEGMYFPIR